MTVRPRLAALVLALVTLLVYLPTGSHGFVVYDDANYITDNPIVQAGLSWPGLQWAATTGHAQNWHPLTWLSHMLDCQLFGLYAPAHHLVSACLHAANAALLLLLLFRLTGALWPSAIVAAFFAWHPLHVESVAWAAERKDVLSAFFFLLTLCAWTRATGRGPAVSPGATRISERGGAAPSRRDTSDSSPTLQRWAGPPGSPSPVGTTEKPLPHSSPPDSPHTDTELTAYPPSSILHPPSSGPQPQASSLKPQAYLLLALALYALGLMAKPMLVTLPCVLLLLDYWPGRRLCAWRADALGVSSRCGPPKGAAPNEMEPSWSEQDGTPNRRLLALVLEKWPFFLLSAASCVITFVAQRAEAVVSLEPYPLVARLGNALLAYVGYLRKMVWPADLAVIYPLSVHVSWGGAALAGLFLAAVSWCAWRRRRERPWRLVGWLWYLGMLVPVIGLVQVGGQAMADRYTYLPLIGIFLALVFEASYWADRLSLARAVPALAAGLALAGCVAMTIRQLGFWRDSQSLFTHALAVTQANPIAHVNLGVALEQAGQRQEARRQYEAALRLAPRLVEAHNGLGNVLQADGRLDAALAQYREAVRLKPSALLPHLNLATLLARLGQYDEAMKECAAAARLGPRDPRPRLLLGKVLLRQRRSPEAVRELHAALALAPNDAQTIVLLARVLASDPDARARNGPAAVALARQALALAGGDSALLLDTLAMALAETGRFDEARAAAQQALDQAATDNDTEAVAALRDRLRLYESRQPWRDTAEGGKQ